MSTTTTDHHSDADLLLAYSRDANEAAFETLARRHVDMIFAVSLRRSGNRQLAEEATQNVLIALTKKARKLSARERNLTAWLHTSTRFEVAKLMRREARIKIREQTYATDNMENSTQDEDKFFRQLLPVLDQAIDHLRAADREVIVRRYLEGQDFGRIGEALGISADAAQKRTSRAFDALNLFFKRKAGVTVSSTALAAGISQYCVQTAPAACLHIAGKAAVTGLATVLTSATLTTMSITKISAVTAGVVLLGGVVAILSNQSETPPDSGSPRPESVRTAPLSSESGSPSAPSSNYRTIAAGTNAAGGRMANSKPYSPEEELAKLKAMSPHPDKDELIRRLSVKHEQTLNDLTKDLELNAAQTVSLKEVLDRRLDSFRESLDIDPQAGNPLQAEKEMLAKAGSIIRGVGLREDIEGILSEDQLAAYDKREQEYRQSQIESHAYRELSKLTPVLELSAQQKNQAFKLLQTSSAVKLDESADARAVMAMMRNLPPGRLEMTDLAEAEFLAASHDESNPWAPKDPRFKEQLIELVGGQISKQVELLAPVLDERQQQRYRDHLYNKSVLSEYKIELPTSGKQ